MKEFKEGDILTLKDVQESFDRINNLSESSEQVDLSGFPIGKDGAVIFETWEEVENTFGRLIPLDDYIANTANYQNSIAARRISGKFYYQEKQSNFFGNIFKWVWIYKDVK